MVRPGRRRKGGEKATDEGGHDGASLPEKPPLPDSGAPGGPPAGWRRRFVPPLGACSGVRAVCIVEAGSVDSREGDDMTSQNFPVPPVGGEGNPLGINEDADEERQDAEEAEEASEEPRVISLEEEEKAAKGRPEGQ